jgi:hypothetical protein
VCISAVGAILRNGNITNGYPLVLWDKNDKKDGGQIWQLEDIVMPVRQINLSYKILANPVTGALPRQNMAANIHTAVNQINQLCININTNFRFSLIEEPVTIGGPNASGHVNFWYGTRIMSNEHLKSFYNNAKLFFDVNNKADSSNAFAWRDNAINIYLTGMGWGGFSAYPENGELIALATDADIIGTVHLHEIGHFFGLPHTHEEDKIADTLVDNPGWRSKEDISKINFRVPFNSLSQADQKLVNDTWSNIMSYHGSAANPLTVFTNGQLTKWDSLMYNQRANVIHP